MYFATIFLQSTYPFTTLNLKMQECRCNFDFQLKHDRIHGKVKTATILTLAQTPLQATKSLKFLSALFYVDNVTSSIIAISSCSSSSKRTFTMPKMKHLRQLRQCAKIIILQYNCVIIFISFTIIVAVNSVHCKYAKCNYKCLFWFHSESVSVLYTRYSQYNSHTKDKHLRHDYLIYDGMFVLYPPQACTEHDALRACT